MKTLCNNAHIRPSKITTVQKNPTDNDFIKNRTDEASVEGAPACARALALRLLQSSLVWNQPSPPGATEFGVTVRARATEIQTGWACLTWGRVAHAF